MCRDEGLAGHTGLVGSGLLDGVSTGLAVFRVRGVCLSAVDALDVGALPLGALEFREGTSSVLTSVAVHRMFVRRVFRGTTESAADLARVMCLGAKLPASVALLEVDLFFPGDRADFGGEHDGHRGEEGA